MDLNALTREMPEDERPRLLAHLLALGADDRHLRFGHALSDDGIRKYVEGIDLSSNETALPQLSLGTRVGIAFREERVGRIADLYFTTL